MCYVFPSPHCTGHTFSFFHGACNLFRAGPRGLRAGQASRRTLPCFPFGLLPHRIYGQVWHKREGGDARRKQEGIFIGEGGVGYRGARIGGTIPEVDLLSHKPPCLSVYQEKIVTWQDLYCTVFLVGKYPDPTPEGLLPLPAPPPRITKHVLKGQRI